MTHLHEEWRRPTHRPAASAVHDHRPCTGGPVAIPLGMLTRAARSRERGQDGPFGVHRPDEAPIAGDLLANEATRRHPQWGAFSG